MFLRCVVLASATASVMAANFPISSDGTYTANVIRRWADVPTLAQTTTYNDPSSQWVGVSSTAQTGIMDGGLNPYQWNLTSANNPNATARIRFTLNDTYSLSKFVHGYFNGYVADNYDINVSTTGFVGMTALATAVPVTGSHNVYDNGTGVLARYVEYVWHGTGASNTQPYILVDEFEAFAEASTNPKVLNNRQGYNITPISATVTSAGGLWNDPVSNVVDQWPSPDRSGYHDTYLRGGGGGDSLFVIDLGSVQDVMGFSMSYYNGQDWANGVKVRISTDNATWTTVLNTNVSTTSSLEQLFAATGARYFEVTDKNGNGGALSDFQIIGIPEPTTLGLIGLALPLALRRRRGM